MAVISLPSSSNKRVDGLPHFIEVARIATGSPLRWLVPEVRRWNACFGYIFRVRDLQKVRVSKREDEPARQFTHDQVIVIVSVVQHAEPLVD